MAEHEEKLGSTGEPLVHAAQMPVENPDGLRSVYANSFGVGATMTDFTMYYTQVGQIPGTKGAQPSQELKAVVTIPISMAPSLLQAVQQVIENHKAAISQAKLAGKPSGKQ